MDTELLKSSNSQGERDFRVLGVRVDAVQIPDVVTQLEEWISGRGPSRYIAVTGMHGVMEAQHDPGFKEILRAADMLVPDGMPLVWLGRYRGYPLKQRVYGPDLMLTFLEATAARRYRHFFYGGGRGVPEKLAATLQRRIPDLQVAGMYSPPFRPLTPDEDSKVVAMINGASPDALWVGLSTPKQERWMYEHRDRLRVPAMIGVGAAFDIHSGSVRQAPRCMREHGLEWFFRLTIEPRRLWKRYLLYGSKFIGCVVLEFLGWRKFD